MNHLNAAGRTALLIGTLLGVLGLSQGWRIATDHLAADWVDHAKWHAMVGGSLLALLSLVLLAVLWGPFRAGRSEVRLALSLLLVGPAVLVLLAAAALSGGAPGGSDLALAGAGAGLGLIAAVLAWRAGA